jgi:hypothetical protein
MPLQPVPLFGLGNFGRSTNVSAQKRTNLYAEIQRDGEKGTLTLYPTPGLSTFVNFGAYPCRGIWKKDDILYVVNRFTLWKVTNDGAMTNIGTLSTSAGRVDISDNGTQIIIVDGASGYIYNTSTLAFAQITDPDFPGADTVTFLNGYFIIQEPNSGRFYCSALYDGLSWNALDFATAESNPDNLVRVMADNGQIWLFGPDTTEPWSDSGALDFPFARVGAAAIEWGLAARWSLCKFMDAIIFLRKNRLGAVQVCTLSGYNAQPVSTPEIDYIFSQYAGVSNATGFAYMVSGHPFYQINFPTPGESWVYDGLSREWHKAESGGGRHRGEIQINFLEQSYVSDYENGKLYHFDDGLFTDDGQPIAREFISRHQSTGNYSFLSKLWLEMEAGVAPLDTSHVIGTDQAGNPVYSPATPGSDPQLMMQYSKDGGHTWSDETWVSFGRVGEYSARASFLRMGRARDWLFKFRVTDPVKTVFIGAWGEFVR